jgi:hypothetical protein
MDFKTLVEACPLAILSLILLTFNLLETLPTTLEEALSAILPPNPPVTSKIISPLFAYYPQEKPLIKGVDW